jgi:hypothetical protein
MLILVRPLTSYLAEFVSKANGTRGLIIEKIMQLGGIPFNVYKKLYDSIV